ncbi:MAG TPA: hypothetical protein PLB46_04155, partial [Chitinophagales bacterium]|nr:hypothetical protein [Chitinophagales bacterium]
MSSIHKPAYQHLVEFYQTKLSHEFHYNYKEIHNAINEIIETKNFSSEFKRDYSNFKEYVQGQKKSPNVKYVNFLLEIKDDVHLHLMINNPQIHFPLQDKFYKLFNSKLKLILNNEKKEFQHDTTFFSRRYKIHNNDVGEFLTAFPTTIWAIIDKESYDQDYVSDLILNSSDSASIQSVKKMSTFEPNQIILGHALSPVSDSIFLLMELGRYLRICHTLNKSPRIYLTDTSWAKYNYSVIEYFSDDPEKAKTHLNANFRFRKKLYGMLGIECEIQDPSNFLSSGEEIKQLEKTIDSYNTFGNLLFNSISNGERGVENKKRVLDFIDKSLDKKIDERPEDEYNNELTFLKLYPAIPLEVIDKMFFITKTVLKNYKDINEHTLKYAFYQRFAQRKYSGCLKVGVRSETKFDQSFARMDKYENEHAKSNVNNKLYGVYLDHYFFSRLENNQPIDIIPYTFPSGRFSSAFPKIEDAINNAILLWDFIDEDRKSKVKRLIDNLELAQLAIQFSDLLSFTFYFFKTNVTYWVGSEI